MRKTRFWLQVLFVGMATMGATAQSFRVQCPTSTITHPSADNNTEPPYGGPTTFNTGANGYQVPGGNVNGAIKCQQISGGDGYSTMGDGTQTYMFSFGPLSGLADIANGQPGTENPQTFNTSYLQYQTANNVKASLQPGDPATTVLGSNPFSFNGAVGLSLDISNLITIHDVSEGTTLSCGATACNPGFAGNVVTVVTNSPAGVKKGDSVVITGVPGYNGTFTVLYPDPANPNTAVNNPFFPSTFSFAYVNTAN